VRIGVVTEDQRSAVEIKEVLSRSKKCCRGKAVPSWERRLIRRFEAKSLKMRRVNLHRHVGGTGGQEAGCRKELGPGAKVATLAFCY